jgi:hypothetical protein
MGDLMKILNKEFKDAWNWSIYIIFKMINYQLYSYLVVKN